MSRCHVPYWFVRSLLLALVGVSLVAASARAENWKAGVARRSITPEQFMWMSGYASRDKPADGKLTDLWAKCLVLEDPAGRRVALVTLDLVGIDREISNNVRDRLQEKHQLDRSQVALNCSHTHTGPVVGHNLRPMYFFDDEQASLVRSYTKTLEDSIVAVVGEAIEKLAPREIAFNEGQATFAVNRRNNPENEVPQLRTVGKLRGPVDYSVPVLSVRDGAGQLLAVAFGYACHATCLSSFQWSGDYPGFAQLALEQRHPEAIALFWAGCGADQNPIPRRTTELAEQYGNQLADAVDRALNAVATPVTGSLGASYSELPLEFDRLPTREQLQSEAASGDRYVASRATYLLEQIDGGTPLSSTYPYPVQVWQIGPQLHWVTLGGEVVVDYALRLEHELGPHTWVSGYTNDVMAYIPSRRVLTEGGYEGGGAMVYYGLPTVWSPQVEEQIVHQVRNTAEEAKAKQSEN
ncbi:MAG: neutral/alkaline non-lysosomal ceramidase N-terminal domain-containing protein [Pirellulales bacterium]|nr:neutral/alkaline non-lysosomal ceramidase N-terminal domain-containing protein [Pirellulales bacterium]